MIEDSPSTISSTRSIKQQAKLIWKEIDVQKELLLEKAETTIGRSTDNAIVFTDYMVSRYHCVVIARESGFLIQDMGSSNGTFVNGEPVKGNYLRNGDLIRVGQIDIKFELMPFVPSIQPVTRLEARISFEEAGQRKIIEIDKELNLGRSVENNVILRDMSASRFHCKLIREEDNFYLLDLESTNGTTVNGQKVTGRNLLQSGDHIGIGQLEILFETYTREVLPTSVEVEAPMAETFIGNEAAVIRETPEPAVEFPILMRPIPVSMGTEVVIDVKDVIKDYDSPGGKVRILKGVNLKVHSGTFVGVRGPSGSGKSTLLNMVTGIDHPTSGEVEIVNQSLSKLSENKMARWRGEHIGVIFQFFQLLPTLTIIENIMLPMDFCRKWKQKERIERGMHLLEMVGLADQAHKLPAMLSGGQQQRAAISRSLANDPPLIVADEPTGNLDSKTADKVFTLFESLVAHGTTFLMVTHDVELAKRIPRVIQVLDGELTEV